MSDTNTLRSDGGSGLGRKSVVEPADMAVAVSAVIFALRPTAEGSLALALPLVRRTRAPHEGKWALPGGWVGESESLSDAASRTLAETTGLHTSYLEQLYTFGQPTRSSDGRVVSVIYTALVSNDAIDAPEDDSNVRWFVADELPRLAFDHNEIVDYALWRLRNKIEYAHVAFHFLGETFSLSQLREVYEAILQRQLDPANFRRQIEASGTIVPTDKRLTGGRHRPPRLYRCEINSDPRSSGPLA